MMTFRRAILRVAIDKATVTATGSPSGMIDTARAVARKKVSRSGAPPTSRSATTAATITRAAMPSNRVSRSRRRVKGGTALGLTSVWASRPISVPLPVPTTNATQ